MTRYQVVSLAVAGTALCAFLSAVVPASATVTGNTSAGPPFTSPACAASPTLTGSDRMANGWALCPAGTQVDTERATSGVAVSPVTTSGQGVYAVTSGIFDEAVESISPVTLTATPTLLSAAYQGVLADGSGHVWVSGGPEDKVYAYQAAAPGAPLAPTSLAGPAPQEPNNGIAVTGYPGDIIAADPTDSSFSRLFVAGTLSVPESVVRAQPGGGAGCPASDANTLDPEDGPGNGLICSVVNVVDGPSATPTVHVIPVGRDAYGLAFLPSSSRSPAGTLFVSNWADQTNPGRTGATGTSELTRLQRATGTVSVVTVEADGTGFERAVVEVGKGPAGIALSPDHRLLVVANSYADTLSAIHVDPTTGDPTGAVTTVPVGLPGGPLGTEPMAVQFSPDGRYVFVALAGLDAVEVMRVRREVVSPLPEAGLGIGGQPGVTSPATYIPTGWWPTALALGVDPTTERDAPFYRLYVANLKGNGAGPGYYGQLQPDVGTGTEGTVSAVDVPDDATQAVAFGQALRQWTTDVVEGDDLAPVFDRSLAGSDAAQDPCVDDSGSAVTDGLLCQEWLYTTGQRAKPPVTDSPTNSGQVLTPKTVHVVFILAENKTFDAYFGDTGTTLGSDADPSFTEYPSPVTTNQHDMAQDFALDDDFWNEGAEASQVGHSWWSAGVTTPQNELTWGQDYDLGLRGNRGSGEVAENATGSDPLSGQTNGAVAEQESLMQNPYSTLADAAAARGESVRVYATDVSPVSGTPSQQYQVCQAAWGENGAGNCSTDPGLANPTPGSDLAFPDSDRADVFLTGQTPSSHAWDAYQELEKGEAPTPPATFGKPFPPEPLPGGYTLAGWTAQYDACEQTQLSGGVSAQQADETCQAASMPNFVYMTLPENHTYDLSTVFNPLNPTPQSMVADNDYGLGKIVQGLSQSPFWKNTIVLLSDDDDQFTGDHVDIHRTFLLAAGGLAAQPGASGHVSDQLGSFPSALKTAEVLLGLPPLTLFDWRAAPMYTMVATPASANDTPYHLVVPATPFLVTGSVP